MWVGILGFSIHLAVKLHSQYYLAMLPHYFLLEELLCFELLSHY